MSVHCIVFRVYLLTLKKKLRAFFEETPCIPFTDTGKCQSGAGEGGGEASPLREALDPSVTTGAHGHAEEDRAEKRCGGWAQNILSKLLHSSK
jgi:hypothetical protein